jgi:hypothetical protein
MKEHYYLLDKLLEYDKKEIRMQYNTNFSELSYKDKHVFDYWKNFKLVSVGASLDAMGPRAELMRKGTDWQQVLDNRIKMKKEVPHVDFYIAATLSVMNILHILDFHKEWVELGLIEPKDFNINICQGPPWYRIDIIPKKIKQEIIIPAYEKHIAWLDPQDPLKRATNGYKSALNFLMAEDNSSEIDRFHEQTKLLDKVRNENFYATFPELSFLK